MMPHVSGSSGGDDSDLASSDEVKVFKDEGEEEEEMMRRSSSTGDDDPSDEMNELKQRLIDEEERPSIVGPTKSTNSSSSGPSRSTPSTSLPISSLSPFLPTSMSPSVSSSLTSPFNPANIPTSSPFGYHFSPFHHSNGAALSAMGKSASPMVPPHSGSPALSFMMHNMEGFPQPPPAHMGSMLHIDPKGIARPYPLGGPSQYSHGVFPDFSPQLPWPPSPLYPSMASNAFRGTYTGSFPEAVAAQAQANFARYAASQAVTIPPYPNPFGSQLPQHPLITGSKAHSSDLMAAIAAASAGLGGPNSHPLHHHHHHYGNTHPNPLSQQAHHPMLGSTAPDKPSPHMSLSRISNGTSGPGSPGGHSISTNRSLSPSGDCHRPKGMGHHHSRLTHLNQSLSQDNNNDHSTPNHNLSPHHHLHSSASNNNNSNNNLPHVKKPLNAFMLYMKEERSKVVAEYTLKESAAINQILGKKWHSLAKEEQSKYYEMAKHERMVHQQRYPGWTARDNYAINQKKKKKKRDKSADGEPGSLKKCRARYGLDQQHQWCKPCRRKKKCIRYSDGNDLNPNNGDRDNLGSVGSTEAATPDSKSANESDGDHMGNLSSAELSLSSPPVPSGLNHDHMMLSQHHHHHLQSLQHKPLFGHNSLSSHFMSSRPPQSSSSSLASLQGPPRNSPIGPNNPLSIEQLTRPHRPPVM